MGAELNGRNWLEAAGLLSGPDGRLYGAKEALRLEVDREHVADAASLRPRQERHLAPGARKG